MCFNAVCSKGLALEFVPKNMISYKLCIHAVITNGMTIKNIYMTEEIKRLAVQSIGSATMYIDIPCSHKRTEL